MALSACGSDTGKDTNTNTSTSSPGASTNSKEKLTLNWMWVVNNSSAKLPAADKDFVRKAIEEKFNVTINLEYMVFGTDYTNKLNLKLSGGDAPDMFMAGGQESNKYILDKVSADLTKYVTPQNMPNYFKSWITEPEMKRYQVQDVFMRAPVPFMKSQYFSYYVRKDWLDKLGLKIPETYDEMINVMKAFTLNDPDGNGKNDTYGFSAAGNGASVPGDFPEWFSNGMAGGLYLENDQFIDRGSDLRTGKVLDDIRKTIAAKIVDPDWYLNKPGQQLEKAQTGKVGIFYSATREIAFDNAAVSVQKKTKEITGVQTADWQPFHIAAKTGVGTEVLPGTPFMFSAKASDEKIKRSIEILDWLSSPEGFLLTNYGQEGVHYKKNGNRIEIQADAYKKDIVDNGSFLDVWGAFTPNEPERLGMELIDPNETDHDRAILAKLRSYKYIPSIGTNVAPPTGTDLSAFRKQMNLFHTKVLFDEKDSSNWPKYRAELMEKYGGKAIFEGYAEQISKALGKTYTFKAAN
ncbi:hypothetical protein J31TS4_43190 [Paenibacillus sp. J31TS4]|nr:hypothetical protein J31TS4_43190 [Paenibacillus sp. J31TS4]